MYRDSSDLKVPQAGVVVKAGGKWRAEDAVLEVESQLRHSE